MKVVRIHQFGGEDVLKLEEVPTPTPGQGEALVRIHAASVNPVDAKMRAGSYSVIKEDKLPYVLGRDLSGVVERLGQAVGGLQVGDPVFAFIAPERGAYAEFAIVTTGEMAPKPTRIDHAHAAGAALAGITAWQGLFDQGRLEPGQRVLIHGGGGGVGHLAIQLAKAKGAWVATTVSETDIEFARQLGTDEVIDYKDERFEDRLSDLDLVFDLIAGEIQDRSWSVLKRGGALISTLTSPPPETARIHGVRAARFTAEPNAAQLREIALLMERWKVRVHVDRTFKLADARAAEHHLDQAHVQGKVVLIAA
jgi:NADPH:quinone reductase-like Zn-dependent oxidoreductase